eukprot:snap_masked-scaffold_34-processed-gene-0.53-mRNA-1 protein AED:1.00 eAED:1.00 QI:0/0/0/0/1/1/2/0/159
MMLPIVKQEDTVFTNYKEIRLKFENFKMNHIPPSPSQQSPWNNSNGVFSKKRIQTRNKIAIQTAGREGLFSSRYSPQTFQSTVTAGHIPSTPRSAIMLNNQHQLSQQPAAELQEELEGKMRGQRNRICILTLLIVFLALVLFSVASAFFYGIVVTQTLY